MIIYDPKELLDEFLNRWTIENVKGLTLETYVGLHNKNTFCQWVETQTRMLGSIKGMTSIKFGIYERNPESNKQKPKNYKNDGKYYWLKDYGNDRISVFQNIRNDIIKIINLAGIGKFDLIDDILLPDLFKWKVAFLYSNERVVPIFKRKVLLKIASNWGLETNKHTRISEIQNLMILNKPSNIDVPEFMGQLYRQFGDDIDKKELTANGKRRRIFRRAATQRNTTPQLRTIVGRSYFAQQKYNEIQETLRMKLVNQYGEENVFLEKNYVDIKLIQPTYISLFEVKSSSFASDCIREALGQFLLYSLNDIDIRPKKHYVVGQYAVTRNDKRYIDFLKENLSLEFDYINIEIQ